LTLNATKTAWTEKVLYSFCSPPQDCTDGFHPEAGLTRDASGNLYGTTYMGGSSGCPVHGGCGTVFELTLNATKTGWTEKLLYTFGTHGVFPAAELIRDALGNLYGATCWGFGAYRSGTVFELKP
jgi:hypothetical protein